VRFAKSGFVALVATLLVACPAVAEAKFTKAASAALPVSSDTLAPPTGVSVKCFGSAQRVTISWTATSDIYATGYLIYGSYGGTEYSQAVSGRATTSYTPTDAVPAGTVVTTVSVYRSWTSVRSAPVASPSNCR
jgi:hypothetical protein